MELGGPMLVARFVERPNRFVLVADPVGPYDDVAVDVPDGPVRAHCPNPGRLPEFREPGTRWVLRHTPGPTRRTQWRAVLGHHRGRDVVLDTHLTNPLVDEHLRAGGVPEYAGWDVRAEVADGAHRFDFQLTRDGDSCLVEVKSVNLVPGPTAYFPDAPTTRGTSHLRHLTAHVENGGRAAVFLVVARDDVRDVRPNLATDVPFAEALTQAVDAGVDVQAWTTRLDGRAWQMIQRVPVRLDQ